MPSAHSQKSNEEDTSLKEIARDLLNEYLKETPAKLKLVDSFMLFYFLCGIVIFAYCVLVTPYPFNTFLSALFSCIGCFILSGKILPVPPCFISFSFDGVFPPTSRPLAYRVNSVSFTKKQVCKKSFHWCFINEWIKLAFTTHDTATLPSCTSLFPCSDPPWHSQQFLHAILHHTACLRIQMQKEIVNISPERAFADFLVCQLVLHLFCFNFMGWARNKTFGLFL